MLVQFAVENFRSFRDKAILSMLAPEESRATGPAYVEQGGLRLLRCAAIYGANASGKSNLIAALLRAQELITQGTGSSKPLVFAPFRLDDESLARPTQFDFELLLEDGRYSYGFRYDAKVIHEEWLYRTLPGSEEERVFERHSPEGTGPQSTFAFGPLLQADPERSQFIRFVSEGTRPNQLFLTESGERNVQELGPVLRWFSASLQLAQPMSPYQDLALEAYQSAAFRTFLERALRDADVGIHSLSTEKTAVELGRGVNLPLELVKRLIAHEEEESFLQESDNLFRVSLKTGRMTAKGGRVEFDVSEESDGTRRFMHLAPALRERGARQASVTCIDELDRSLHSLLTRKFVQSFLQDEGLRGNQLLFTTHDTNLLTRDLLPVDSIWFMEKDTQGASRLYSLAEFKPEQLAQLGDRLEEGYLQGRFGAIPFLAERGRLGWFDDSES